MRRAYIAGIDEAGRGPLAGPVSVAMVIAPVNFSFRHPQLGKIRDCKQLTPAQRERWYDFLVNEARVRWVHSYVSSRVIDRINIAQAVYRGIDRLVERARPRPQFIYLDGSLKLSGGIPHRVIIGGDERVPIIAAASIIAKVRRDRYMARMASRFPAYEFDVHKGYGTPAHFEELRLSGPSPLHRASFLQKYSGFAPSASVDLSAHFPYYKRVN